MKSKINPRPVVLAGFILLAGIYKLFMASATLTPLLLIGNFVFGALLFESFVLMQRRFPILQVQISH